jgi:hypothetical protein
MLERNVDRRGHAYKLKVLRASSVPRRGFLSFRVAHRWNNLPGDVVDSDIGISGQN